MHKHFFRRSSTAVILLAAWSFCSVALADHDHGGHHDHYRGHYHGNWHGDIHHFHRYDYPRWREGRWYHGPHGGRLGWWWTIDNSWYFYPQPVYPYPDPYTPPVVYREQPADEPTEAEPEAESNWYYCNSAKNYYPYVSSCPEGWQTVPATPPDQ